MSRLVGAYVCPRGIFGIEVRQRREGLEVLGSFGTATPLASVADAAGQLTGALAAAGIKAARVALAVRGFDVVHHALSLPPARDDLLIPIVEREIRRLEPQFQDPIIAWLPLHTDQTEAGGPPPQRQLLVAACERATARALEDGLREAGHTLLHLTALPSVYQRLEEELAESAETTAFVAPLPDGAFLGFFLGGVLRLVVEPPLAAGEELDATSLGEEIELGAMFVRQQFRGAHLERVTVAQGGVSFADAEARLLERLQVPVNRLDVHGMSAAALAAMGAVLDARSAKPLALAGITAARRAPGPATHLHRASIAAVVVAGLVAIWTLWTAISAREAASDLASARQRIEQESFGMLPLRETADQRRMIQDAVSALRFAQSDRAELQRALAGIAASVAGTVRMDSLHMDRGTNGWVAALNGTVTGTSNAVAVQALHDFYRQMPARLPVEALALEELSYADADPQSGRVSVRFRVSFELPTGTRD